MCARALLPTRARACRRERVPASPRERFNFDHLCPRVRAPRLTRTAAVNYQGSIALTRKAPIRMSACLLRARARGARACHSIVDEVWLPSTGARLCAVNAPFPQSGSARGSYQGSILTVHHLLFNCGKESVRACVPAEWRNKPVEQSRFQSASTHVFTLRVCSSAKTTGRLLRGGGRVLVLRGSSDARTRRQTSVAALIPSEEDMMSH